MRKTIVLCIGLVLLLITLFISPIDFYKQSKNEKVILQLMEDEAVVKELFQQSKNDLIEIIALGNRTFKVFFENDQIYLVDMEKNKERYTFEIFDLKNQTNMIVGISA